MFCLKNGLKMLNKNFIVEIDEIINFYFCNSPFYKVSWQSCKSVFVSDLSRCRW